ncbi:uncharacterized protein LOC134438857 [Engraulis encrasicolus]|uniref:uncharacterized protein LOC134438857 n=1 Tax=Engraulis encrasicolus TaxID=184585 RepID=UPI002FD57619
MGGVYILSLTLLVYCEAFDIQGPSGRLSAPLGGSVVLPCSVEPPLPLEELEIEWRRRDTNALVHLFQEEDVRPESQDVSFSGRAFFFKDELEKGNYSLLISSVVREDTGGYICKVYTNLESNEVKVEISVIEHLVVKGAGVVPGNVGKDVVLGCAVDSRIPSDKVDKVIWKRTDQDDHDIVVLLYHLGVVLPNSSHERYQGRVELFTTEIPKGNFSLRLDDVRTEDQGEYICEAQSGHLSASAIIVLQEHGSHPQLILAALLSLIAAVTAVGLGVKILRSPDSHDLQRVKLGLILCPNILIFTAFMLYGVTTGFLGEIVTCATVNFVRCLPLLKAALHTLPDKIKNNENCFDGVTAMVEYYIIAGVLFSRVFTDILILGINAYYVGFIAAMYLLFYFAEIFGEKSQCSCFAYIDIINWVLLWLLVSGYSTLNIYVFITTLVLVLGMDILFHLSKPDQIGQRTKSDDTHYTILLVAMVPLYMLLLGYIYWILADVKDGPGLIWGSALLYILTVLSGFRHSRLKPESELNNGPGGVVDVFFCASTVLPVFNSGTLIWELMARLWNGVRYITDLRVFVLPTECLFALGRLALKLHLYKTQQQ